MAPRRRCNKSVAGYYGVRHRDPSHYGAEITVDRERVWLSTFDTPELSARAYDAAAWRFDWHKRDLNFLEVQSWQEAEFLAHEVRVASCEEVKEHRCTMRQLEADKVAMSRYIQEHPDEVHAEYEFFAARNATEKKIEEKKEEELKEIMWQIDAHEYDEVAMVRYREEHLEEVHAKYDSLLRGAR
jgi:hypothetical protein